MVDRSGWTEHLLGQLAEVSWGNTSLTKASYVQSGYRAYSATGPDGFVVEAEHDGEGIVLSAIGARCGRCFWASGRWTAIKNTITIRSNGTADLHFLYYFLNRPDIWPSEGGAQPFIALGQARTVRVCLPPHNEQKKIAEILSLVDDAIESTQAVIAQLHVVKNAMMAELLTCGLPSRRRESKRTDDVELPVGWSLLRGEELFTLAGGHGPSDVQFSKDGSALFLKVDDFNLKNNRGGLCESALRYDPVANPGIRTFARGDIVFPKRGAAIFKGRVRLLRGPATVDPNLMVLRVGPRLDPGFFVYVMLFIGLHNLSDNSGVPQINNKHLYPYKFSVPPLDEQVAIRRILEQIEDRTFVEMQTCESLTELKSTLSSALLTGEIRVTPAPESP